MKNKKILFIVEGAKTDVKLMEHLMNIYYEDRDYNIWSYKSNIHAVYEMLEKNDATNFDDLDFLYVLRSQEKDPEIRKRFNEYYSNIVLVFDYDPQDNRYNKEHIEKMMHYFNNAQENGILYLNYPMVEVFKKMSKSSNDLYENTLVDFTAPGTNYDIDSITGNINLRRYKEYISNFTCETDWTKYTREMCNIVLIQNLKKYNKIVSGDYILPTDCNDLNLEKILQKQNEMLANSNSFYELCTCIFYMLELRNKNVTVEDFLMDNDS